MNFSRRYRFKANPSFFEYRKVEIKGQEIPGRVALHQGDAPDSFLVTPTHNSLTVALSYSSGGAEPTFCCISSSTLHVHVGVHSERLWKIALEGRHPEELMVERVSRDVREAIEHLQSNTQLTGPHLHYECLVEGLGLKERPQWLTRALGLGTLDKLRQLLPDWNGYGAAPPSEESLIISSRIFEEALETDLIPVKMVPSAEGGVALIFRGGHVDQREEAVVVRPKYADIEIGNDGSIVASTVNRETKEDPEIWSIWDSSFRRIKDFLGEDDED